MKFEVKYVQLQNRTWLVQKYELEKLSCNHIAKEVGCSKDGVRVALIKHDIKLRQSKETNKMILEKSPRPSKYELLNDKAWLEQKHSFEKVSLGVLTKLAGAKQSNSVVQALKKFNIAVIPHEECLIFLPTVRPLSVDEALKINEDVISGCLLGDAWLDSSDITSDNSNPSFNKRNKFYDHVELINNLLFDGSRELKEEWHHLKGKEFRYYKISSLADIRLMPLYRKWYPAWNNYEKVVPQDIRINEVVLLHWFLDDGSTSYRKRKYKFDWTQRKKQVKLTFCSECFTKENQQMLCDKVNDKFPLALRVKAANSGTGWRIGVPQSKVNLFLEIIGPPMTSLAYKWKLGG